ncbi:hypothetical protein [Carboxylicivirga caseinilyticus]|uniref:hypothetical protein n=1 Tax=Carboxylicivirga caseinilyticus TaxID=3417572 RepID=UPI003D32E22E|nr:hypothetical protein [Marinilabiliaceae bacterium A049]
MNKRLIFVLVLTLAVSKGFAQDLLKSKEEIVLNLNSSDKNVRELKQAFPIYRNGIEDMFVTLHCCVRESYLNPPDKVQIWKNVNGYNATDNEKKYQLIYEFNAEGEGLDYIENVAEFTFKEDKFIKIEKVYYGSGHQTDIKIIHITSSGELKDVMIESATDHYLGLLGAGEFIGKGEIRDFKDNSMLFSFLIYNKGDANCCPTGGSVTGQYKLVKTRIDNEEIFKLTVDTIHRNKE